MIIFTKPFDNMKKTGTISAFLLLGLLLISCSQQEGKRVKGDAVITFLNTRYEYGEIPFKGSGNCEFMFRNTGKTPLVLTHVKSTCGCTIPEWPREPIKAGDQGAIQVTYDTRRVGTFAKSIYVYSNASNGVQRLLISGKVIPHEQETIN
jgi:hypothetical protein